MNQKILKIADALLFLGIYADSNNNASMSSNLVIRSAKGFPGSTSIFSNDEQESIWCCKLGWRGCKMMDRSDFYNE